MRGDKKKMPKKTNTYYRVYADGEVLTFPTSSIAKDFAIKFSVGRNDVTLGFKVTENSVFTRILGNEIPTYYSKTVKLAFAVLGRHDIDTIGGIINYDSKCDF